MTSDIDLDQFSSSPFFKGSDLTGGSILLTISDVTVVEFSDGKRKPTLSFSDDAKQAVLGPLNLNRLKAEFGLRTSAWIGRTVVLTAGPEFNGYPTLHILPHKPVKPPNGAADDFPY